MNRNIAWAITGSGTFLRESFKVMSELKSELNVKVTTYLSGAGLEVVKIYGLYEKLNEISPGGYYEEVITEEKTGKSCVHSGRFTTGRYRILIVSPATSNTVAKIVYGVADSIVTTIVSQALKGNVPVIVLPCDVADETTLPCFIDREKCDACGICVEECPYNAISFVDGKARINLLKCMGCSICSKVCPLEAIICWMKVKVKQRNLDLKNIRKLSEIEGITVIKDPVEIKSKVMELL